MTFTKTHTANRGTSTYKSAEGLVLYVPKSAGEHPESIEVTGLTAPAAKAPKATLTPEQKAARETERKAKAAEERARVAGLTPAQKKEEKARKLRERLAALETPAA